VESGSVLTGLDILGKTPGKNMNTLALAIPQFTRRMLAINGYFFAQGLPQATSPVETELCRDRWLPGLWVNPEYRLTTHFRWFSVYGRMTHLPTGVSSVLAYV
jgi:hypothetical protein